MRGRGRRPRRLPTTAPSEHENRFRTYPLEPWPSSWPGSRLQAAGWCGARRISTRPGRTGLFHDANRALRKRWLGLLEADPQPARPSLLREAVATARAGMTGDPRQSASRYSRRTFDTLLVPSNGGEYLSEIEDRQLREAVIGALLGEEVLPALQAGPAGTAAGLNVHGRWAASPRDDGRHCRVPAKDWPA